LQRYGQIKPAFRLRRTATAAEPFGVLVADRQDLGAVHPRFEAFANLECARDVKEALARTADSTLLEGDARYANIPVTPYELPDGTLIEVNIERFQMAEVLFDPSPMAGKLGTDLGMLYGDLLGSKAAPGSMDSVPKIVGR
jgi:actin-like protein 6A